MAIDRHTSTRTLQLNSPSTVKALAWLRCLPLSLIILLPINSAFALDYTLNITAGSEFDDNATRQPSGFTREELETSIGADLGVTHTGQRLDLESNYNAAYNDYKNDEIKTNNNLFGTTDLNWNIIDQRLAWNFNHFIAEVLGNNRATDTPDNRETRQTFATGPTITAKLTGVDDLIINANYTVVKQDNSVNDVAAARSNIDSERGQAAVTWRHALSRASDFDIGASVSQTEFDNNSPDFEYQQVFVGYNVRLASGSYSIRLGVNESQRENEDDQDGVFTSVNYLRNFSAHALEFSAVRQLTDSSIGLDNGLSDTVSSNFDETSTVERTNIGLEYSYNNLCSSCNLQLAYLFDNEDFLADAQQLGENALDSKEHRLRASLEYRNNSKLTSNFSASYGRIRFSSEARTDDVMELLFNLDWRAAEKLRVNFSAGYNTRDTKINLPADFDHEAVTLGISAIYTIK